MLAQQFWIWGCDIRRPEGNLLTALGFEKEKQVLEQGLGISRYHVLCQPERRITLWGFGLWVVDEALGALFLPRSGRQPRFVADAPCTAAAWTPEWFTAQTHLTSEGNARASAILLMETLHWIAWYEREVSRLAGQAYRQETLDVWPHAVCTAEVLAARWDEVAGWLTEP